MIDLCSDDVVPAYDAAHAQVPREVLASHVRYGIREMSIYRLGTRLVMVMTVGDDFDPEGLDRANETDPVLADWQRRMTAMQVPAPGAARWAEMRCVFRQSDQIERDRSDG